MLRCSVVIPTFQNADGLGRLLGTLAAQELPADEFEIVVVDDGSTDHTAQVVESFRRSRPHLLVVDRRQPNGGVNAARNAGTSAASGPIVVYLDDDERVAPSHLRRIVEALEAAPDLPGIGGPAVGSGTDHLRCCENCRIGDAHVAAGPDGMTDRLLGGNMALRRSVLDEVGLFDASISGRGDEVEWFHRAARRFRYEAALAVEHDRQHLTLSQLLASGYHQGRATPLANRSMGRPTRIAPLRVAAFVGHALRRRCVFGLLQSVREIGTLEREIELRASSWRRRRLSRSSVAPGGVLDGPT